jgi:polyisoprenoid-binding protein YceI
MIRFNLQKVGFVLAIITLPSFAQAAVSAWKIVPEKSEITFTATQNRAPLKGSFKTFTGEIKFDREQLDKSDVKIVIDIGSLAAVDSDIIKTLLTPDWFDAAKFPKAVFTANAFAKSGKSKTGEDTYQAKGKLTIRDKTIPVTLSFVFKEYSPKEAQAIGETSIKRTEFGVGQGEWSSSAVVEDIVQVSFVLTATSSIKE